MLYTNCQFYCLSFYTENRANMEKQFRNLGIDCIFSSGLQDNDNRLPKKMPFFWKRQWAITYSHFDILYQFCFQSNKPYAVICEDDICIHSDFHCIFKKVLNDFNLMALDMLLLSYQLPYKIDERGPFTLKVHMPENAKFKYYHYPSYVYGTQMYIISRNYAMILLTKYYHGYAGKKDRRFLFDKLLMNTERRAVIYPMLAIENERQTDLYHRLCHKVQISGHESKYKED